MKKNGWKKLKEIISNYASKTGDKNGEGLVTPVFVMKPRFPVFMNENYAKVINHISPNQKFLFAVSCAKTTIENEHTLCVKIIINSLNSEEVIEEQKCFREEEKKELLKYSRTPLRMFDMKGQHIDLLRFEDKKMSIENFKQRIEKWMKT
jgi:thiamine kinase-like enzyme